VGVRPVAGLLPGHFDLLGQVSYRTETTAVRWFSLPGVALNDADMLPIYARVVLWCSLPLLILPLLIVLGPAVAWLMHNTIQRLDRRRQGE